MSELALFFANGEMEMSIRGMKADDDVEYWSVFDFINEVCEKEAGDVYARTTFNRMVADGSEHQAELMSLCKYQKFKGK